MPHVSSRKCSPGFLNAFAKQALLKCTPEAIQGLPEVYAEPSQNAATFLPNVRPGDFRMRMPSPPQAAPFIPDVHEVFLQAPDDVCRALHQKSRRSSWKALTCFRSLPTTFFKPSPKRTTVHPGSAPEDVRMRTPSPPYENV